MSSQRSVDLRRQEEAHLFKLVKEDFLKHEKFCSSPEVDSISSDEYAAIRDLMRMDAILLGKLLKE